MNDPFEQYAEEFQAFLNEFSGDFYELAKYAIQENYTQHPIFVAHNGEAELGETILNAAELETPYSVNISSLEEFEELSILNKEGMTEFLKAWGNPMQNGCFLWIKGELLKIVFFPLVKRITDTEQNNNQEKNNE